jgi:hypothetical protein
MRRMGLFGVLLLVGCGSANAIEPSGPKEVIATKLILVDESGSERGKFEVTDDGMSGIMLKDSKGNPRAMMGVDDNGSILTFMDKEGNLEVGVVSYDDVLTIMLFDKSGEVVWGAP